MLPSNSEAGTFESVHDEVRSGRVWLDRLVVLGYAVITGVFVVRFALLSDWIFNGFIQFYKARPWAVFVAMPFITACVVSITNRYFPGTVGSGIPQVRVVLDPSYLMESDFISPLCA